MHFQFMQFNLKSTFEDFILPSGFSMYFKQYPFYTVTCKGMNMVGCYAIPYVLPLIYVSCI